MATSGAETPAKPKKKKRILLRIFVAGMFLGVISLGVVYGLAKFGLVRLPANPALTPLYAQIGLKPKRGAQQVAKAAQPDPLAEEKRKLSAMREALQKERDDWESLKQSNAKKAEEPTAKTTRSAQNSVDPKALARMAMVYEEMPIEHLTKIFALLPDDQVIQLLRRMEEKKVADILAAEKPVRAARFSVILSQPPKETASAK